MTAKKASTILIIEDNPASIKFLQTHLEAKDYNTIIAQNGFEGLNKARSVKPDLIMLDIMLPDLDGHKLCRMIKFDNSLKQIPVAMFTSRDTEEDAEIAKKMGANAFLLKNTRIEIILSVIEKLISDYKAKKEADTTEKKE